MTYEQLITEFRIICDSHPDCNGCQYDDVGDYWMCALVHGFIRGKETADVLNIDMEKPMQFTDEQKAWVKNYIIINAKRQRADAIDECERAIVNAESKVFNPCADKSWDELTLLADRQFEILEILKQLKEQQ